MARTVAPPGSSNDPHRHRPACRGNPGSPGGAAWPRRPRCRRPRGGLSSAAGGTDSGTLGGGM
eukprot:1014930-Prymnesium_polylepis.1